MLISFLELMFLQNNFIDFSKSLNKNTKNPKDIGKKRVLLEQTGLGMVPPISRFVTIYQMPILRLCIFCV